MGVSNPEKVGWLWEVEGSKEISERFLGKDKRLYQWAEQQKGIRHDPSPLRGQELTFAAQMIYLEQSSDE